MLTCVLNLTNSNTRYTDLEWYKLTKSTNTIERMDPYEERINFLIRTTGNTTSSSLNITNAAISHTGYYWVKTPSLTVCNVSLTVLTGIGMYYVNYTLQNSYILHSYLAIHSIIQTFINSQCFMWNAIYITSHYVNYANYCADNCIIQDNIIISNTKLC